MAKKVINVGTNANPTGDSLKNAFTKVNDNFTELYNALGLTDGSVNVGAFEFSGSTSGIATMTTTDSSAILIDQTVTVGSDLTVGGDIFPSVANGGDLGSSAKPWRSLYVSNNTIYLGGTALAVNQSGQLTINGSTITAGSVAWNNVTGKPTIPTLTSQLTNDSNFITTAVLANGLDADLKGSVFADDSTLMVDAVDNKIYATELTVGIGNFVNVNSNNVDVENINGLSSQINFTVGGYNNLVIENNLVTIQNVSLSVASDITLGGNIRSNGNINIDINLSDSTLRRWQFGEDGDFVLPRGSLKPDSVDGFLTIEGPVTADMIDAGTPGIYDTISNGVEILTHRPGDDLDRKFRFSWDGALYMPTDSSNGQVGALEWRINNDATTSQVRSTPGGGIFPPGLALVSYGENPGISFNVAFHKNWIFDQYGNTRIPGDIRSEGNINIDINLTDSTLRRWTFGEDGKLTFPDGANYAGQTVTMPTTPNGVTNSFVWEFSDQVIGSDKITLNWNLLAADTDSFYLGTTHSTTGKYLILEGSSQSLSYISNGVSTNSKIIFGAPAGNNAGDVNAIELKATNGDVYLTSTESIKITVDANDSSARVWTFDPTGELAFPDGTAQTTAFTGNATTVDIMNTNGIDTDYSITFVENRDGAEILRADVDLKFNSATNLLTVPNISVGTGITFPDATVQTTAFTTSPTLNVLKIEDGVHEKFQAKADATGVVAHDCSSGHVFYHTSPDANWTVNLTNLNLSSGYATAVTLVIVQGGTGYYPSAVQIGGVGQTLNWQGNTTPTPSTNRTDVVTFSIINNSGTYTVLGQLTGF